jgi:DNA-binding GntR family transcriptional regulator
MTLMEPEVAGIPGKIADQLRNLITRGSLAPGMHLGQSQLADRFEASRVPVREALKLLVAEGLINHDPNRGFFVAEVSSAEARQLYRMRHLLESELLSTVAWPDEEKLAELVALVDELDDLSEAGDRARWAVRHRDFHNAVFDLSPDKTIVAEVKRLWTLSDRYRSLMPPKSSPLRNRLTDENQLIKALKRKNREDLLRVFSEGRTRVEKMLLDILQHRGV